MTIIPWLMLALFYFLAAGSDPTPETTWSTFYREMLSTGEVQFVHYKTFLSKTRTVLVALNRYLVYVYCL